MTCGRAAVACGRVACAPISFHCAPSYVFHPTERAEREELDGVMIVVRLIGDSVGKELSMANKRSRLCLDGSLARPAFGLAFLN
jgi:hypothetical protein